MRENITKLIKDIKSVGKKLDISDIDDDIIFEKGKFYMFGLSSVYVSTTEIENEFNFSFKKEDLLSIVEKGAEYFITSIGEEEITVLREVKIKISRNEHDVKHMEFKIPLKKRTIHLPRKIESLNLDVKVNLDLMELSNCLNSQESLISLVGKNGSVYLQLGEDKVMLSDVLKCDVLQLGESKITMIPKTISTVYKVIGVSKKSQEATIEFNSDFIKFTKDNVSFYVLGSK